jgi:photosystem II stability/assembly factor-like uncharacterized protein
MASKSEVEARLRGYAREYDRDFPSTTRVEGRIMARIAITPRPLEPIPTTPRRWRLAGLVRDVAIACVVLLLVGLLVVGVAKLRALPRNNVPSVTVPGKAGAYFSALSFVSANDGWIAETRSSQSFAGPTVLYRTTDGGHTWQRQLTWDGPGPEQVRFSPDGRNGLVVGRGGVPLFRTADGGANWERRSLPPEATQVALLYFLDAREGWVISYLNEATPGFAGVFHTTDGALTWTQTARLDVNKLFSYGQLGGSLQGSLMFHDSSIGWYAGATVSGTDIPIVEPHLYTTRDGGKSWSVQILPTTPAIGLNSSNASISLPQFFSPQQGILVATKFAAPTLQGTYFYSTVDGGAHWTGPQPLDLPSGSTYVRTLLVIDASHWFILSDSAGIARSTDGGRHWTAVGDWPRSEGHVFVIDFQDADTGWAGVVGTGAQPAFAIYRTTDAGAHWTRVSVPDIGG